MATETTKLTYIEGAAPSTPAASRVVIYAKADGLMYSKDDAGSETLMSAGGGGIAATIFDAKGDLIAASAADTAARLAAGANGTILEAQSGEATGLKWSALGKASYKRTSADYTTTSNTFVDVDGTNMALTITTGARRVMVVFTGSVSHSTAADYIGLDVDIDGAREGGTFGIVFMQGTPGNEPQNGSFTYITEPLSAGSHTFKLQWRRLSAGTITMHGTGNAYAKFAVVELA
jgi:hypothetical protein